MLVTPRKSQSSSQYFSDSVRYFRKKNIHRLAAIFPGNGDRVEIHAFFFLEEVPCDNNEFM